MSKNSRKTKEELEKAVKDALGAPAPVIFREPTKMSYAGLEAEAIKRSKDYLASAEVDYKRLRRSAGFID